ncbi:MAG: hypothetical protein V4820_10695 [Pseudomonadota bacterium]
MGKHWMLAALIAASWAGTAMAGTIKIEPVETLGSMVEFRDGVAGARSSLARSDAALLVARATHDDKDMPSLVIAVENHGQAPFNMTPSSVSVTTQSGAAVAVYTRDEVMASLEARGRKRAKWAQIAAAMDGAGAAARDRPTPTNPRIQDGPARVQAENEAMMASAEYLGFVAQTVQPGEKHMTDLGLAQLPKDTTDLTVAVTLAGETHRFPLKVTRYR